MPKPIKPCCTCGTCGRCRDLAKWERIFKEKFEDPAYYQRRPPRTGSTLGEARPPTPKRGWSPADNDRRY